MSRVRETDLYPPIKAFLAAAGYEVKAEIGAADVVALRDGAPPVIVELKAAMSLALVYQGIARLKLTDHVYLAVPHRTGMAAYRARKDAVALCRRLGLGFLTVRLRDGHVQVHCEPGPYAPRKSAPRRAALLAEFARRAGDPNRGGATRARLVTAYRQDALRCAAHLAAHGPCRGAEVAQATGVGRATRLMRDNHYGWFARVERGTYDVTAAGRAGLAEYGQPAVSRSAASARPEFPEIGAPPPVDSRPGRS